MAILHKTLDVITIITSVRGLRNVTTDKNTKTMQIVIAYKDKCCYNKDTLARTGNRPGEETEDRMK